MIEEISKTKHYDCLAQTSSSFSDCSIYSENEISVYKAVLVLMKLKLTQNCRDLH